MLFRILVIVISFSVLNLTISARAEGLVGTVRVEAEESGDAVKFKDGDREAPTLKGQTAQIELRPPTWIDGKVFSNDDMLMYSFYVIAPFKKEWRWEIPNRKISIDLKPTVVRYWKGYKPEGKCRVTCIPMGKGKFKFHHTDRADGPHGYMERIGFTANGFPKYRFWFDDDGTSTPDSSAADSSDAKTDSTSTSEPESD